MNDIMLIQRLKKYDDEALRATGLKMMKRHSWYLSPELSTLSLFSQLVSIDKKAQLVSKMNDERGLHLVKTSPDNIGTLHFAKLLPNYRHRR